MARAFQSKKFPSSGGSAQYRALVRKYPFALFGLPFITIMVAGSFFLTPAAAIRYERYDKKVKRASKEEILSLGTNKRKVDPKEEYYRLAAKDIDNWEQRRVKRLPGEPDGILE
ncbi:cytochrome c oxidase assembly protein COX16, mitochondrial [Tothia fuscella]|uniref:Cytochrome c oxidase assembly protein COX16, mitochondrial n=1 Tax=Tothia fuscella TaxID=1048955 RepID=A0A9P4TYB2_9PEZI|nr:cytochrome c oxidase assembly protein COX16, mitochondrial [Tothia fuscella]